MKKVIALTVFAVMLGVIAVTPPAQAAGTQDNWSVKLTFYTSSTQDLLPITVGEGAAEKETMKPPPMPGKAVTNNPEDAIVNAYIKTAGKKAAESVQQTDAELPGRVWPIEVNVEEGSAQVRVSADLSNAYSGYNFSIVDPATGAKIPITQSNVPIDIFTADATGGLKTIFVMAGSSNSFAVADAGKLTVGIDIPGRVAGKKDGVTVSLNGSQQSATTNTDGIFTMNGLAAGTYKIRVDGPNLLASQGELTVGSDGTYAMAIEDPKACDANEDASCDVSDFLPLKACFGQTGPVAGCDQTMYDIVDFNKDGVVDVNDFLSLKSGFGLGEPAP